jgi:hypothetical protein
VQPAAWGVFRVPRLEVDLVSAAGRRERRVVALTGRSSTVEVEFTDAPVTIHVDPRGLVLATATVTP